MLVLLLVLIAERKRQGEARVQAHGRILSPFSSSYTPYMAIDGVEYHTVHGDEEYRQEDVRNDVSY